MRIAIIGAGAVGGVVAWHLAKARAAPVILARPASADCLRQHGLTLIGSAVSETVPVNAVSDSHAVGVCDLVLLAVKAHDLPAALPLILPLLRPHTIVVPMVNGIPWWYFQGVTGPLANRHIAAVDPDRVLSRAIPVRSIVGCVVYMGASREAPHRVAWNGRKRLLLGEPAGGLTPRLRDIAGLLSAAELEVETVPDIRQAIWEKMLGNVAHNPLSVVTGAKLGRLAETPRLKAIMRLLMEETASVAEALGIRGFAIEARLNVAAIMADFRTSMLQDFEAGRPLELGAIVDAVVEIGTALGIATPVLSTVGALALERWLSAHARSMQAEIP